MLFRMGVSWHSCKNAKSHCISLYLRHLELNKDAQSREMPSDTEHLRGRKKNTQET
jgi:hypothetical protein